ncbi:VENN motif pre-toxin domain-containing protein [Neisseria sp.]|uniref:VENN motif pre-toxin domain-containing protein n=1 Tax=Neisseria sp. TaxID=192066 RepID=UPI0026DB5F6E|nr:VENN motif pre-toxin domain-containing protein [Neisseria sp.]MDO4907521.1 VENN motif pre-toxin domain-containing protein [Neisseria sp.]
MGGVNLYSAGTANGGSRSSTTRSGIGTRNITIGNDPDGTQAKAAYTDTRTETAEANTGRLNNMFDKDRVRKELDRQREVTQQFGGSVQQVRTEINRKAEGYRKLAKIAEEEAAARLQNGDTAGWRRAVGSADENRRKAGQWQKGGVALSALASGLAAPADSGSGIAAAALNPAGAYAIGQYFKGLAQENLLGGKTETAELTAAQETARAVAHGVIAAATAAAGGSNALSAAISAGGAEAAAPYVSQWLYGEKDGSKLTAGQKETVSAVLSLGGAAVGAASGNGTDAVEGSRAAQNAVENNYLLKQDWDKYRNTIKSCSQSGNVTACYRNAQKYLYETSKYRNEKLKAACAENGDITLCSKYVMEADLSREVTKKELGSYGTNNPAKPLPAFINYYDIPWSDNPTIHYWATSINLPIANKLNYGFNLAVNRLTGEIFIGVTSSPNINKSNGNTKLLGVPSISATIGHINNLSSIEKAQLWKTISDTIQGQSTTASGCGYFTCFGANKTSSGKVSFELGVTTAKPYSVTVGKENMIRVGRIVRE